MRGTFALLAAACVPASAQELVVNYLGGVQPPSLTFGGLMKEPAAIGVSPDGRYLYATQASLGLVGRYDLRQRTYTPIRVPSLTESRRPTVPTVQSISAIAVNADGTALIPLGLQIAKLELDGQVTLPGVPFRPMGVAVTSLQAVVRLAYGPGSNTTTGVFGEQQNLRTFWNLNSPSFSQSLGSVQNCFSNSCDNSALRADSPGGMYQAAQIWGVAMASTAVGAGVTTSAYFTDPESQVGFNQFGIVAMFSQAGTVTILGHATFPAIPVGSSGSRLLLPTGLALDPEGNLFVADTGNHRILRRTPAGVWSVLAGTGTRGASGDGDPAANAQFFEPKSLAIDASGAIYVHDSGNGFLRRIRRDGIVERINSEGTQTEPLIRDVPLPAVTELATDNSGQIYVASQGQILRVDTRGRVTRVAGTGEFAPGGDDGLAVGTPLGSPVNGLAVDSEGRVMWSETFRVRRVEGSGIAGTIAGNGLQRPANSLPDEPNPVPATSVYLHPTKLSAAPDGSVLITAQTGPLRILRDGQLTSITNLPQCGGFADGIPAIFACMGGATERPLPPVNPESFIAADGRVNYANTALRDEHPADGSGARRLYLRFGSPANHLSVTSRLLTHSSVACR